MTQLVTIAKNPAPSGARVGVFNSHDGKPLRYALWEATRGSRRGTVCCFTGRSECIEKYFETVADLRRRGFAVAIMDWRGQGGSFRPLRNPRKGYVGDFSEYDRDLALFMREIVLPDCPPPYMALAHSMGGHILIRNASAQGSWFERMILTAPMLSFHRETIGTSEGFARAYARVATSTGFGKSYVLGGNNDPGSASRSPRVVLTGDPIRSQRNQALSDAAPELLLGAPTIAWFDAAFRSMSVIGQPDYPKRVTVPLLMFYAGRDTIVANRTIEDFAARLKLGAAVPLPDSYHEILQENDDIRARFWAAVDAYLGLNADAA